MKHITIISDDLTGAVDSSSFYVAAGGQVRVEASWENRILPHKDGEAISVNMSSRTIPPVESKKIHTLIGEQLKDFPDQVVMKKMDTGFRGNAVFEIEGLMDGLKRNVCFVLDHSPTRNTFTLYGNQYVEGVILHKSVFAKEDPLKRPTSAYIPDILAKDATKKIGLIDVDSVKGGHLAEDVAKCIADGNEILVFDVIGNGDCQRIIHTLLPLYPDALWAGSNGLGWGLANELLAKPKDTVYFPDDSLRCLCFTASAYSVVRKQIAEAEKYGLKEICLDMDRVISGDDTAISEAAEACISTGKISNFILSPKISVKNGGPDISNKILNSISECAKTICAGLDFDRIVVVGGETSFAILDALKVSKLYISEKPETGIGTGVIGDGPYKGREFSIKGGSIGSERAICRMMGISDDRKEEKD